MGYDNVYKIDWNIGGEDRVSEQFQKFFSLGFFPEELPPEFGPFGITEDVAEELWNKIDSIDPPKNNVPSYPTEISFPKSEYVRRDFHFLNPIHFARLSYTILNNWEEIIEHTKKSTISTSRLSFSDKKREIFKHDPFSTSIDERISRSASKKFVLYVDIENYYPSIYTHSIDWALNQGNKRHYSQHRNRDHLGVALDEDVRKAQHNITSGIVIGPVTSRIISEIITCHFDGVLDDKFDDLKGTRYVDDYHLFLSSREEIEEVQIALQKELSNFKLKFNEAKITIDTLPEIYSDYWTKYFDKKSLTNYGKGNKKELLIAFSKAFELSKNHTNHPSLRYLFRILENDQILRKFELPFVMEMIHHSFKADSRSISRACVALAKNKLVDENLNDHISHFEDTLIRYSELSYTFEVLWLLYLFLHAKKPIPEKAIDNILINCDIPCLAYLFICWKNGIVTDEKIQLVRSLVNRRTNLYEDVWKSPFWLLAFEDNRQGWELFDNDMPEEFKIFLDNNVEFLSSEPNKDPYDVHISRYELNLDFEVDDELEF